MADDGKVTVIEWDMMHTGKFIGYSMLNSQVTRTFLYPLLVVKTRLQVQKQSTVYSGSLDAFKKIYKSEGLRGLYRGYWVNSVQVVSTFLFIAAYEKARNLLTNHTNIENTKAKAFIAGGLSSGVSQLVIIPFDVVSQHIMLALHSKRQGPLPAKLPNDKLKSTFFKPLILDQDMVRRRGLTFAVSYQILREGGPKGFYRGSLASYICFVPSSAFWWLFYVYFNELLCDITPKSTPHIFINCVSATVSGAAVTVLTNPLDLYRTNIQVHRPSSYGSALKYLWREDRWNIFTKGLSARVTQSCISSFLLILGYETLKRYAIDDKYRDQVRW